MSKRGGRGKVSHKGRRRHFTDEEDLKHDLEKAKREQEWRQAREIGSDDEGSGSDDSSSDEEGASQKRKGVSGLIEIENPNRVQHKSKKADNIEVESAPTQLSRREREELAKQQEKRRYQKLHAEGKTEQGKADLARLAIIRRQREEAARKREEEKKAKEQAKAKK
ncbi:28 kDa heat- and acid-stable phosphoprotein [Exaiptasia diaphana]|uniref:Casein kinase substrate phosphoprotein PP28 domain-containing protein n=1 Tax=Exaiptasia diaphana TaxID=2652724 RepID=A0A913Y7J9_EXADI|nr:28 kDa heat- and acid-stable phosphoprotein [Exaiptasia diaphana]KXJ21709.1 28 kDa heat- and acid-stable phosphoprotein [Exaiptasia diaphana]